MSQPPPGHPLSEPGWRPSGPQPPWQPVPPQAPPPVPQGAYPPQRPYPQAPQQPPPLAPPGPQPWAPGAPPAPPRPPHLGRWLGLGGAVVAAVLAVVLVVALNGRDAVVTPPAADGASAGPDLAPNDAVLAVGITPPDSVMPGMAVYERDNTVVGAMYAGLTRTDPKTGLPVDRLAESITTNDAKTWTIRVKPGYTFWNGEPVTAKSFVDAWNFTADDANGQLGSFYLDRVAGWREAQGPASTLSGLELRDPSTFTVTLAEPWAAFPTALTYPAFMPLAEACLAAAAACESAPIGNGPFRLRGTFQPNAAAGMTLERWDGFAGDRPRYGSIRFAFVPDPLAAQAQLTAGQIDFTRMYGQSPGVTTVARPTGQIAFLGFPTGTDRYRSPELRRAVSLSIDREKIARALGVPNLSPATSFTPPGVPGHADGTCADCRYDPAAAKALLAAAAWPADTPIEFTYSAESASAKQAMTAICQDVATALGVPCRQIPVPGAEFGKALGERSLTTAWYSGWIPDQVGTEAFLRPLYGPGNHFGYANPSFDALVNQGNAQTTLAAALPFYARAEALLNADMPTVPFTTESYVAGLSTRVDAESVYVEPGTEAPQFDLMRVAAS